jgi:undecaprenyl diphosphate synthase
MTDPSWKRRAESMLSEFIDGSGGSSGDVDDIYYGAPTSSSSSPSKLKPYFRLENFSTSADNNEISCGSSESVIYDRLLCGCCNNPNGTAAASCGSLFLQWVKLVLGRAARAYLSNPLLLALLPLVFGAAIGFYFGSSRNGNKQSRRKLPNQRNLLSAYIGRVYETFHWLCLHLVILLQLGQFNHKSDLLFDNDNEKCDERSRTELNAMENKKRESGVDLECVPRHVAVIMDGNRRYGKEKYGNSTRGHLDGSRKLIEFAQWCFVEGIEILTVYAFSTENWNRDAEEVSALMSIFCKYCDEIRTEAIEKGIRIHVLTTEGEKIPEDVRIGIKRMEVETRHCTKFTMNICLSYGGRNEIVNACKSVAIDLQAGKLNVYEIGETVLQSKMLTSHCCDPEVIIRTSGEERISNFLLWQAAYSEFFFLKKQWPELEKGDLLDVIRDFATGRTRRFGK